MKVLISCRQLAALLMVGGFYSLNKHGGRFPAQNFIQKRTLYKDAFSLLEIHLGLSFTGIGYSDSPTVLSNS